MEDIDPDVGGAEWSWGPLVETVPLKSLIGADVKLDYFSVFRRFVDGLTGSCFMNVTVSDSVSLIDLVLVISAFVDSFAC